MEKIICLPYLYGPPQRLKLDGVKPLLEYLHGLPQECCDRELSWAEDELACDLLLCLPLPPDSPELQDIVEFYIDPQYRKSRTLCVWYGIARSVARSIQDGD
jgi:hypothetical protein